MVNMKEAFQFPFNDKFWARRILIGGFLLTFPIIGLFSLGYLMRHFEGFLKGHKVERLPEWDDLLLIISHGFFASVIFLGYLVIPFLIVAVGIKVWGGYFGYFLIILGFITATYLLSYLPMGLAHYLMTGKLVNAFRKDVLYEKINSMTTSYYSSIVLAIFLFFLGGNSPFVLFYLLLVLSEIFGKTLSPAFTTPEAAYPAEPNLSDEATPAN